MTVWNPTTAPGCGGSTINAASVRAVVRELSPSNARTHARTQPFSCSGSGLKLMVADPNCHSPLHQLSRHIFVLPRPSRATLLFIGSLPCPSVVQLLIGRL